jgi:allantoin racemase
MRIWYQSFTDPDETRSYHDRLVRYAGGAARSDTRIDVFGMQPPSRRHRITELRCAIDVVRNAIRAGEEGYDAFILGHFQDSGLWEARSAASIPVLGLGET